MKNHVDSSGPGKGCGFGFLAGLGPVLVLKPPKMSLIELAKPCKT